MKEIEQELNSICANEHFYSDEDLANKINRVIKEKTLTEEQVNHEWACQVLSRRTKEACKRMGVSISEYSGPLPSKKFNIR